MESQFLLGPPASREAVCGVCLGRPWLPSTCTWTGERLSPLLSEVQGQPGWDSRCHGVQVTTPLLPRKGPVPRDFLLPAHFLSALQTKAATRSRTQTHLWVLVISQGSEEEGRVH